MTRDLMIAIVTEKMAGAPEPEEHWHIECHCPDREHRTDEYEDGCFCYPCASKEAVKRGLDEDDTEHDGGLCAEDRTKWCENCGCLITSEITPDGAEEELDHWDKNFPDYESAHLNSPSRWREFLLCVNAIPEAHLPRVQAVIERACQLA